MIGIEVFAGPGGMGLGAAQAGVEIKIAVEKNYSAAQTYLKNHKNVSVTVDDIENINDFSIKQRNQRVVLFGGPPCQGFSHLNRQTRNSRNPKNWLFQEFVRAIKLVQPDWVVLENVPGLKNLGKGEFLEKIFDAFKGLGYSPNMKTLNAADFGVPQLRERIFIVGSRDRISFDFPIGDYKGKHFSVMDAISDLPSLSNGAMEYSLSYKFKPKSSIAKELRRNKKKVTQNFVTKSSQMVLNRYRHVSPGGNWKDIPINLMNNYKDPSRCHYNIYRRLPLDKPSPVIANYRKSMMIHPVENRGLSLREAARLQSFPDWYEFCGNIGEQQQQVGDAVPPKLAQAVFKKIIELD